MQGFTGGIGVAAARVAAEENYQGKSRSPPGATATNERQLLEESDTPIIRKVAWGRRGDYSLPVSSEATQRVRCPCDPQELPHRTTSSGNSPTLPTARSSRSRNSRIA